MSFALLDADILHSADRTLLDAAYASARASLRDDAGLTDAELDALANVISGALVSLFQAGQQDPAKLSTFAVAKALRRISAGRL